MSLMMLLGLKLLHDLLIIESRMHEAWLSLSVRIILDVTVTVMGMISLKMIELLQYLKSH